MKKGKGDENHVKDERKGRQERRGEGGACEEHAQERGGERRDRDIKIRR